MRKSGPILVIDDDSEDLELIGDALKSLNVKNDIELFQNAHESLDYLSKTTTKPFFILCDVNMSQMSGFELRQEINKHKILELKSIPFLFLSTSGSAPDISRAYKLSAQGYFKKPDNFEGIKQMLKRIIEYWESCLHPMPEM
jgi:CheY-like chemotaxis protein